MLMLQAPTARHSIWLHGDRAELLSRERKKGSKRADEIARVCALYGAYDQLISDSPSESAINSASLVHLAAAEKFTAVTSLVGGDRILREAADGDLTLVSDRDQESTPRWLSDTAARADIRIFVGLGRLSIENNPSRLLRAFAAAHASAPNARLIVMGDGPLMRSLSDQVTALGLRDEVWLAGYRTNPFALLRQSDCVVIAGRGVSESAVIAESRVLGLPVVTVSGGSGPIVVRPGVLEVAADDHSLARGMIRFLDGAIGKPSFDWVAQNDAAIASFYRAIGVHGAH